MWAFEKYYNSDMEKKNQNIQTRTFFPTLNPQKSILFPLNNPITKESPEDAAPF